MYEAEEGLDGGAGGRRIAVHQSHWLNGLRVGQAQDGVLLAGRGGLGYLERHDRDSEPLQGQGGQVGRVAHLTGGLAGYFAAHADLADVAALVRGAAAGPHGPDAWPRALARISAIPQPVIAAVNGQAWGGGLA